MWEIHNKKVCEVFQRGNTYYAFYGKHAIGEFNDEQEAVAKLHEHIKAHTPTPKAKRKKK